MADVSTIQMGLTRDTGPGGFMERLTVLLAKEAGDILKESGGTPYHQQRASYAQRVIGSPHQSATMAGPIVVMHTNIASYTVYDEESKISTTDAPDNNIEAAVSELWNALAGIDTPS